MKSLHALSAIFFFLSFSRDPDEPIGEDPFPYGTRENYRK